MKYFIAYLFSGMLLVSSVQAIASDGCKPHSLFTPLPGYHVDNCEHSRFDAKEIPVRITGDHQAASETIEGVYEFVVYSYNEGTTPASPLHILQNHLDAAKARGATVVMQPGPKSFMAGEWADIQQQIATIRMQQNGREYWVHLGSVNDGDNYAIASMYRKAMDQEVSVNELLAQFEKDGFLSLEVNFDTARATIRPDSLATLDRAATMLRQATVPRVEVGGHTDNVGGSAANLALSQQRADSVRAALIQRGIHGDRLVAKGYGDTMPVADNRSEEGRSKNRRVELVKK